MAENSEKLTELIAKWREREVSYAKAEIVSTRKYKALWYKKASLQNV